MIGDLAERAGWLIGMLVLIAGTIPWNRLNDCGQTPPTLSTLVPCDGMSRGPRHR